MTKQGCTKTQNSKGSNENVTSMNKDAVDFSIKEL